MRPALTCDLELKTLAPSARYGEAASYRSTQWLKPQKRPEWMRKTRAVSPFSALERAIAESRSILGLPDDWDDMGSPAFSPETLERAATFLMKNAEVLWLRFGLLLPSPRILPGPSGSIDLHWTTARRELLINIPSDPQKLANYYGDNFGADKKKGAVMPTAVALELFSWLTITD